MHRSSPFRVRHAAAAGLSAMALAVAPTPATADGADMEAAGSMSALERVMFSQSGRTMPVRETRTITLSGAQVAPGTGIGIGVGASAGGIVAAPSLRDAPDVFGSIALPVRRTALDARWRSVATAGAGRLGADADRLLGSVRALPVAAQADRINRWVNRRVAFTPDRPDHDRWSRASETLARGRGDCEDYAVAKMEMLRAAGVPAASLYLVVVYDLVRRQDHAVLVVRAGRGLLLLDNGTDRLQDAAERTDYRPMLSFSGTRAWVHGYAAGPRPMRYATNMPVRGTPS